MQQRDARRRGEQTCSKYFLKRNSLNFMTLAASPLQLQGLHGGFSKRGSILLDNVNSTLKI